MTAWEYLTAVLIGVGGGVVGALATLVVRYQIDMWKYRRKVLGLRCLVCGRPAGYGGRCPNEDHNL